MLTGTSLVSWARLLAVTTTSARVVSSSAAAGAAPAANAMGQARLKVASKPPTHHGPDRNARRGGAADSSNCNERFNVQRGERITYSPIAALEGRQYRNPPAPSLS